MYTFIHNYDSDDVFFVFEKEMEDHVVCTYIIAYCS